MNNSTGSLAKVSYLLRYKPDNILAPIEEAYDIATEPENLPYASRIAILFRYVNPSFLHISPLYFQWPWQLEVQQHFVASWPFAWSVAAGACGVVASSPKQAWTPSSDIPKCKCSVLFGSNYKTCNAKRFHIYFSCMKAQSSTSGRVQRHPDGRWRRGRYQEAAPWHRPRLGPASRRGLTRVKTAGQDAAILLLIPTSSCQQIHFWPFRVVNKNLG